MTKNELTRHIARQCDTTNLEAGRFLEAFQSLVMTAVATGDKVTLVGFGSFSPQVRAERQGRNPQTGEPLTIPQKIVPVFSAGQTFKEIVDQ
ncbi:HU family DNA-binding protein [Vacuolonema iberomarrocanum]|uniref:HU family DNA-binding protein n=1 Tax=Vacuolonema iberomarrocanum TaxID=3454632 RepID=UPI0019DF2B4B|nr:HU family DNA-binding protein [filamentous cyanobacterium LEGE 07170]